MMLDVTRDGHSKCLGEVIRFRNDIVHPKDQPHGSATFVGLEHIERDTGVRLGSQQIRLEELTGRRARFFAGDIVYGYLRPYLNKVWIAEFDGICSVDQYVFEIQKNADPNYVAHYLRSPAFLKTAPIDTTPGQLPRIRSGEIADTPIPLPPMHEQQRIAAILDQADALRRKRREAQRRLDHLSQSIFIEMFHQKDKFKIRPLNEMCDLITDGTHYTPTYTEKGVMFISAKNVTTGYIDWGDTKYIPESLHEELRKRVAPRLNDVLLAKNGTTGVAAIVDRDCTFDIYVSLALLRPSSDLLPVYLRDALNSPLCKRQFQGSLKGIGVPNLHLTDIRRAEIPHPPIEMQRLFAERIACVEQLRTKFRLSLTVLDSLFASLQHRAFRGEL